MIRIRRVEPESELDARPQLDEVLVRHALAPPSAAVVVLLLPRPRLVAVGVRGPRLVLDERRRPWKGGGDAFLRDPRGGGGRRAADPSGRLGRLYGLGFFLGLFRIFLGWDLLFGCGERFYKAIKR